LINKDLPDKDKSQQSALGASLPFSMERNKDGSYTYTDYTGKQTIVMTGQK